MPCYVCSDPTVRLHCGTCKPVIGLHRNLLRNLHWWTVSYIEGRASMTLHDEGEEHNLLDVLTFYQARTRLRPRQAKAIEDTLYHDRVSTNAERVAATEGLANLLGMARRGEIPYALVEVVDDPLPTARSTP